MRRMMWAALLLIAAALACNAPASGVDPTEEVIEPTAEEETEAPEPTEEEAEAPTEEAAEPTDAPPAEPTDVPTTTPEPTEEIVGGFSTGDSDPLDLPDLEITVTGGGPILCGLGVADDAAPFISEAIEIGGSTGLCFVNYPAENGTRLTVEIGNGEYNYFAEFYVQSDVVYGPDNQPFGEILNDGVPSWFMWVHIPAWLPQSGWVVESALSAGGGEASLTLERESFGFISIGEADNRPDNPLLFPYDLSGLGDPLEEEALQFVPGQAISIAGANDAPSAALTVALYRVVDAETRQLVPHAATTLNTDAGGQWEVTYTFDEEAEPGRYVVVVNPTAGETVTPFNGYLQLVEE